MPILGQIKIDNHWQKYIWASCEDCGKERWVRYIKKLPLFLTCISCGHKRQSEKLIGTCNHGWRGGKWKNKQGYRLILLRANDFFYRMAQSVFPYVLEHRLRGQQ